MIVPITDHDLLSSIADRFPEPLYLATPDRVFFLNRKFLDSFGGGGDGAPDAAGIFSALLSADSTGRFQRMHALALTGGEPVVWEDRLLLAGEEVAVRLEVTRGGGEVVVGAVRRVDPGPEARALQAGEITKLVLDTMEERVSVTTDDYRIIYANQSMLDCTCASPDEPCYRVCGKGDVPCPDCAGSEVFTHGTTVYKEHCNAATGRWFSVIERAIEIPGIPRRAKLAVARDVTQRKEGEIKIRALSHRLLTVQEEERKRLSRELHDDLGQQLNVAKLKLSALGEELEAGTCDAGREIGELNRILQDSIDLVRRLAAGLRPPMLERLPLTESMRNHCASVAAASGLEISFSAAGMEALNLGGTRRINLFRILQEALHNAVKHAAASRVRVRLLASFPTVRLLVEDDGRGFNVESHHRGSADLKHLGLVGIAERVELLGGTFRLTSGGKIGTRLEVEVPVADLAAGDGEVTG